MPNYRPLRISRHRWKAAAIGLAVVLALPSCTTAAGAVRATASSRATDGGTTGPTIGTASAPVASTPVRTTGEPSPASHGAVPRTSGPAASEVARSNGDCVAGRCYTVGVVHQLPAGVAPESSGIAASATSPGSFFVVDDGTGADQVVAVRSDGSLVANLPVSGMSAGNAEALAAGPCGDRSGRCLYVGDIGDNAEQRDRITVYRLAEPSLAPPPESPLPADAWHYRYPDGPHNAEAMVIADDGSLIVITKSAPNQTTGVVPPHRIYRGAAGGGELRYVSSFSPPNPARRFQSLFTGTVVTDAAYAKGRLLLLTYDEVIEYLAPAGQADPATFPGWPHHELPEPPMVQSEGITGDISGCGYEVTSEEGPGGSRAGLAGVSCH